MSLLAALLAITLLLSRPHALNVIQTNDDGWATAAIRAQHNALNASQLRTGPVNNQSGTGSLDFPATPLAKPCEFNTCPAGSPAQGFNASDPTLNYVNSFPVTSVKYGLNSLASKFFGRPPDLVVSGPNVGTNTGLSIFVSGTVGAASAAALAGIPSLAISATSGSQVSYTTLQPNDIYTLHAALSLRLITALTSTSSTPFLPASTLLNINYPAATAPCLSPSAFTFVLTRAFANPFVQGPNTCGSTTLPVEGDVLRNTASCEVSVSVLDATTKFDAGKEAQQAVLDRLSGFLGCSTFKD